MSSAAAGFLAAKYFSEVFECLRGAGYRIIGPRLRAGAIVFDALDTVADMACGVLDEQAPGSYTLSRDPQGRRFAWATGPQALKPLLFAPREPLWQVRRDADGALGFESVTPAVEPTAVIGLRACDLAALALQDAHFLHGPYPDPAYAARRAALLLVAVNCARSARSCFCVSTGDGPQVGAGADLTLTELADGFVLRTGSERGQALAATLTLTPVTPAHEQAEREQGEAAAAQQSRALPGRNLRDALMANLEHPRWAEVAARCLACGNCTSVCPTCFCHAESEVPVMEGASGVVASEHLREWDSCFAGRHAYMAGHALRPDIRPRYRQWLTHKLATWHDQYGRSGCVGCGRCVTWCPVGIDLTEEAAALCAPASAT